MTRQSLNVLLVEPLVP